MNPIDVPDPSDFPPLALAPGLRTLDASLRCTICGELFDGPVTLPCGHCFCSYCIRTAMAEKQECPSCRKTANEGHLRSNPIMEEVISSWKASRPYILQLSKEDEERQMRSHLKLSASSPNVKKRKRTLDRDSSSEVELIPGPSGVSNTSTITKSTLKSPSNAKDRNHLLTSNINQAKRGTNPKPDDLVTCPICQKQVQYKRLNTHIDRSCLDTATSNDEGSKKQWLKLLGPQTTKSKGKQKYTEDSDDEYSLPKASYGVLKDKKLKEMLQEHDLPVTGDRNQLISRHQRWVMLFNANLDKSLRNRKSREELRRELKKWEEDTKTKKSAVVDVITYQKNQKSEFDRLVQMARLNKTEGRPPSKPDGDATCSSTPSGDTPVASSPCRQHSSTTIVEIE